MQRLRKKILRDHVPWTCAFENMSAYPLNAHRIHSGVRVRWYWFVANLYLDSAANLPWNELFILRCVFPVESVLAYGELHVEKLLCRIAYQLHVRVETSTPSPVPCKISDRVLYTESITFFPRFFLFFFSLSFHFLPTSKRTWKSFVDERWKHRLVFEICNQHIDRFRTKEDEWKSVFI